GFLADACASSFYSAALSSDDRRPSGAGGISTRTAGRIDNRRGFFDCRAWGGGAGGGPFGGGAGPDGAAVFLLRGADALYPRSATRREQPAAGRVADERSAIQTAG